MLDLFTEDKKTTPPLDLFAEDTPEPMDLFAEDAAAPPSPGGFRGVGASRSADDPIFRGHGMTLDYDDRSPVIEGGKEAVRGLAQGALVDTPETYLRAARVTGLDKKLGIDTGKWLGRLDSLDKNLAPEDQEKFKTLRDSFRMVPASVAAGLPGAVAGAAGGPVGAVAGYATSGGVLFGLAEYDQFMEEAEKLGIPREKARNPAILSALAEGGFEALSNVALGKLLGLTKPVTAGVLTPLRTHLMNMSKSIPVETISEMATAAVQDVASEQAGMPHIGPWEAAKEVAPAAAGGAALLTGGGAGGQAYRERRQALDLGTADGTLPPATPAAPTDLFAEDVSEPPAAAAMDLFTEAPPTEVATPPVGPPVSALDEVKAATEQQIKAHEREQAAGPQQEPTVEHVPEKVTPEEILSEKGKPDPRVIEREGDTRIPETFKSPEDAIDFGTKLGKGQVSGVPAKEGMKALGRRLREKNKRLKELYDKKEAEPSKELSDLSYQIPRIKEAIDAAVKERRLADKKKPARIDKERTLDTAAEAKVNEGLEPARVEDIAETVPEEVRAGVRKKVEGRVKEEPELPQSKTEKLVPPDKVKEAVKPAAWEISREEYVDHVLANRPSTPSRPSIYNRLINKIKEGHKEKVKKALAEGKTVPPEVLKDYPSLAKKPPAKKAAVPEEPALTGRAAEDYASHLPILQEQVGREVSAKRKLSAAGSVIEGINPKAQEALVETLFKEHPEVASGSTNFNELPIGVRELAQSLVKEKSPKVVAGTHKQAYRPAETRVVEQELIQKFLEKKQEQGKPAVASAPYIWAESGKYTVEGGKLKKEHPLSKDAIGRILENNYDETGKYGSYNRAAKELIEKERAEREVVQEKKHAEEQAKREKESKEAAEQSAIKEEIEKKYGKRKFKKQTITVKGNDGPVELSGYSYKGLLVHKEAKGYEPKYVVTHIKSGKIASNKFDLLNDARLFASRLADTFDTMLPEKRFLEQPGLMDFASALRKDLYVDDPQGIEDRLADEVRESEKGRTERGEVVIPGKKPKEGGFSFASGIEERFQKAQGTRGPPLGARVKEKLTSLKDKMLREYEHLPRVAEWAKLRFALLKLAKQKGVASDRAVRALQGITAKMNPREYDLFRRKVILDDLNATAKQGGKDTQLPFGFTAEELSTESQRLEEAIGDNKTGQDALQKRRELWDSLKTDYTDAMGTIGFDVSERLAREDYFRHQVLEYANLKGILGTGKKLRTPTGRSFLKQRKGSTLDINTDYIQAEHEVMAQMIYDIEVAKTIHTVNKNYNIVESLKKQAKKQNETEDIKITWQDLIPEGYMAWQPREGNVFYLADTIPAKLAEQLASGVLEKLEITPKLISKALAVGGPRKEMVVKTEVAATLDALTKERSKNVIAQAHREVLRYWKIWQLISPRRYGKYNLRNLTGDSDGAFAGNPASFKKVPHAIRDLHKAFFKDGTLTGDLADWVERGGVGTTLQAQEMGEFEELRVFKRILQKKGKLRDVPIKVWNKYWKAARLTTDFRESILRYASYLSYLEQMQQSKDGTPKNYGASIPEEIKALSDIKDRAFWLSNDLLGAYDRIGVAGQNLREHLYPFWSWKEVNMRRYTQMFKNAAQDKRLAGTIGRKLGARTPIVAYRTGKFMIQASAFWSALQVWNYLFFSDEEKDLPEGVRTRPHIILGRADDGEILYFSRIGALGDLLEWFGLDSAPHYVNQWFQGRMSLKEVGIEMAKSPVNVIVQGGEPMLKIAGETLTRQALFPDAFEPRPVRDRMLHLLRGFGLDNEYRALAGKPSKPYKKSATGFLAYSIDPLEAAYGDIQNTKYRWLKKQGKYGQGFWLTAKGNALYNMKSAVRYKDKKAQMKYMGEYLALTAPQGDAKSIKKAREGITRALENMEPLAGLSKVEQVEFLAQLNPEETEKFIQAYKFYEEILTAGFGTED